MTAEVQIARLEERLNIVLAELQQARDSRKVQYEKLEIIGRSILEMDNRVESVEKSLAGHAPTIEEFITIKHKVQGAGMLGNWLWAIGGGLIGFVFSMREAIVGWIAK